jgi:hypothetical protein
MVKLFEDNGMKPKKLRILKLETVRVVLMCVLAIGKMKSVKSNRLSKDLLSSPSMFSTRITVNFESFLISFFVWDKTMKSSTLVFKI